MLAEKAVDAGQRVLVLAEGQERLQAISARLWQHRPCAFLANGIAGGPDDARQPVLLAERVDPANGAGLLVLADGLWRDPGAHFDRVMLVFDEATRAGARACWRQFDDDEGVDRHFWKQDERGRWVEAA